MSKHYSYQPPDPEPQLNVFTKYPYKVMRLFKGMSTEKKIIGVGEMPDQGGQHIAEGAQHEAYNSDPPTSGWMYEEVAGAGKHDSPVADESLLHSMEHGAVVVHYKDDLPKDQVEQIKKAFYEGSGKKILVPRKNLDVPVALTSWRRLLKLQSIDEAKIKEFIYVNNGGGTESGPI